MVVALPNKISPPSSPPIAATVIIPPPPTFNEPVKLWTSSDELPNADEPLEKLVVKYVIEFGTIYCLAIKSPVTVNEPVTIVLLPN